MADAGVRARAGDLWGGLAASLVALPSSIAFGVLVYAAIGDGHAGQGAVAGAIGAGVLGVVASLVGRNGGFVTAPCAPAAAVMSGLAGSLVARGLPAERVVALLALAALLSAGLQMAFGALRLGRLIKYIPYQVVSGYLSGVAVIIALGQLPKLLGLPPGVHLWEGALAPATWAWPGVVVGMATIATTFGAPRVVRAVPAPILGLLAGVGTYLVLGFVEPSLWVLADNPLVVGPLGEGGSRLAAVTDHLAALRTLRPADVGLVLAGAGTLAVLLSIDTLKTGVVLDTLTRTRHETNRELFGQGVANGVAALVGGMPGAGTMGPTLVNVSSGGRSPWSGFATGAFALFAFLVLGDLVAWVPIGALAGLLLVVAWRMFDWGALRLALRADTRLDFAVIVAVVITAESVGLIEASVLGIGLSILLFIRDQIHGDVTRRHQDLVTLHSKRRRLGAARAVLDATGDQALVMELQGNLFFGTTDQLFSELANELDRRRYVLLDLRRVQSIDYTAGHLLRQMHERLAARGGGLLLCRVPTHAPGGQDVSRYLTTLELVRDGGVRVFATRNQALEWIEDRLLAAAGHVDASDGPVELSGFALCQGLDGPALAAVVEAITERALAPGEAVFDRGDDDDALYLVRSGLIDITLPLRDVADHQLATLGPGDYFGEMAFLDRGRRSALAKARTAAHLYVLSRARFDDVAERHPEVGTRVYRQLARLVSARLRATDAELGMVQER